MSGNLVLEQREPGIELFRMLLGDVAKFLLGILAIAEEVEHVGLPDFKARLTSLGLGRLLDERGGAVTVAGQQGDPSAAIRSTGGSRVGFLVVLGQVPSPAGTSG